MQPLLPETGRASEQTRGSLKAALPGSLPPPLLLPLDYIPWAPWTAPA